jgi:putative transposase
MEVAVFNIGGGTGKGEEILARAKTRRTSANRRDRLGKHLAAGNPYDNAQAKAGWSTLKTELLPQGSTFASLEEARLGVGYYLDTYFNFNLDRRHSALGYRSPH